MLEASPPPGFALPGLFAQGRIEVVEDERGIGERIASRLLALGVDAHSVREATGRASGIIFARGLLARDCRVEAIAVQRSAIATARALARSEHRDRVLVTLQDTGGDFARGGRAGERAWSGGLAGLAKTAAAEWPDAAVKAIDVATADLPVDTVADRVVLELLLGGGDVEVALGADGGRSTVAHRRASYRSAAARVYPGSVVVVSGGARGVTAASLLSLCKYSPKLALLGRTALVDEPPEARDASTDAALRRALLAKGTAAGAPPHPKELAREAKRILDGREIRANIAALERAGAEVAYHAIDVSRETDVRACIDAIRRGWGPIRGIIHGAGVLADALIANQTDDQFERVFGAKVEGLRHLLTATAGDPLELLILFSSVAGRLGNPAQAAYSMANETLSAVAANEKARRSDCLVRSLAWGPWDGGMVTAGLAKLFEKAGVRLIALDVGAEALAREVASDDDAAQVVLMNGEPPAMAHPLHGGKRGGRLFSGEDQLEIVVNQRTYPQLDGHRIPPGGSPIVPAALVVEWFFRAAATCLPSRFVRRCRDIKVLRGVAIERFTEQGLRLIVRVRRAAPPTTDAANATNGETLEMQLVDDNGRPRYSALVDLADSVEPPPPAPIMVGPPSGESSTWSIEQVYSEVLFHRPPFAGIRSLDRVFDASASADVAGMVAARWPDARWRSDVAVVDAGLQLACIWGRHVLGGVPLPTKIAAIDLYTAGPIDTPVRCLLRGTRTGQRCVLADVFYLRHGVDTRVDPRRDAPPDRGVESGRAVIAVRGLEMHLPLTVPSNGA